MSLKEETKKELGDYFKKLAEKYEMEEEDIVKEFQKTYDIISKSPSMRTKSEVKRIKRTKAKMAEYFVNIRRNGKPFVFIPFGHSTAPKDWNEAEIKKIYADAASGKIPTLLREGKILFKIDGSEKIPVSQVQEWGKRKVYIKDGKVFLKEVDDSEEAEEFFVVEGTPLKSGDKVIPRDSRIYLGGSNKLNFNWSKQLKNNYTVEIYGIGFPKDDEDDVRMVHIRLRNEQADPNNHDFFFKKYPPFRPYEADFSVEVKDGVYELNYIGRLHPRNAEIPGVDDNNIDDVIEVNLEEIREKYKKEGVSAYVPPVIYIDGIKAFHESTCKRDKTGKIMKSAKGWDLTEWGKYAILLADFESGKYATEKDRSNFYLFSDGDVDFRIGGFGDSSQYNMTPIQPATPIISLINTSRGPTRYDFKTGKRVIDPENGDINLNIMTIRALPRVEIELDEKEDWDEED